MEKEIKNKGNTEDVKNKNKLSLTTNKKEYENISNEQNEIKKLKDKLPSYKNVILGTGLNSQMKRQSYKLSEDGRYGNLTIDWNQLKGFNKLVVTKDSEIIINQNVDDDFIELITKRYNLKKTYSKESEDLFRDLTELSGLPMHKTSSKFKKIIKPCECTSNTAIEYYNDLTELLNELEIIMNSFKSGNTSPLLLNKGIKIIDELIQKGLLIKNNIKIYIKN